MLACESDGNPVMTEAQLGKGRVVFVSFPVELRTISTPGAFAAAAPAYWRILSPLGISVPEVADHEKRTRTNMEALGYEE